ncbi:MAG TPA: SGNH/GDSL hydrolase family protein [Steroidobacteraceae bacterium]|nr:SGNH/GDSL hydrolase family protein [Steroidobacteraceae bacterium]
MKNRLIVSACLLVITSVSSLAATKETPVSTKWVGSWASSQLQTEPKDMLSGDDVTDSTIRQVIRLSAGGKRIRIVFSNAFSNSPLKIDAANVAVSGDTASSRIKADTVQAITFSGQSEVIIPSGSDYLSDPINMPVAALTSLTISFHVPNTIQQQTSHPGSRATSYVVKGNRVSDAELGDAKKIDHWYQLAAVHVETDSNAAAIVTLGDSITDGRGATTNANNRWPDFLAERLQASPRTRNISVLNHGIGGNRLLQDGLGPNVLARLDRDVIAQPGVKWLIVLEGINDLGTLTREAPVIADKHTELVKRMIAAYVQIVARAHAHNIKVIGATILPDGASQYYHPDALNDADRNAVNEWIRTPGNFDAFVDLDRIMRDPEHPERLLPAFDSGDGLHPSPAGFRVMAEAFPLTLFEK